MNNLIQQDALAELGAIGAAATVIAFSALMPAATLALPPIGAATAYGIISWNLA